MFRFINYFATAHCDSSRGDGNGTINDLASSTKSFESKEKKRKKHASAEDPLSCVNPACADKLSFFKQALEKEKGKETSISKEGTVSETASEASNDKNLECPLDRSELGRSTWNFLHTLAAYYPDNPTSEQKQHAVNLVQALAVLYPCHYCASEFQETITTSPPRVSSREELSIWLCEQHNLVNERLGKPSYDCSLQALDKRWKDGVPGCWNYSLKDKLHDSEN